MTGLMFLSIFTILYATSPNSSTADAKLITYPAYLNFRFPNGSLDRLNEPIGVEDVITVNFEVGYKIGPAELLNTLPGKLWLFSSFIVFPSTVNLEVVDKPDWAQVYVSPSSLNLDVRSDGDYEWQTVSLIISPLMDAPAEPDQFIIRASSSSRGRIDEISFEQTIPYEPDYNPLIYVTVDEPTRTASPGETINFKATVENQGNKETLVTVRIKYASEDWAPVLSISSIPLGAKETKEVSLSLIAPYNFGWHDDVRSFTLEFTPEMLPRETPPNIGTPEEIQVRIKSMGFFPGGLKFIVLFIAIIVILLVYLKKFRK
jgi:hypothetical protein